MDARDTWRPERLEKQRGCTISYTGCSASKGQSAELDPNPKKTVPSQNCLKVIIHNDIDYLCCSTFQHIALFSCIVLLFGLSLTRRFYDLMFFTVFCRGIWGERNFQDTPTVNSRKPMINLNGSNTSQLEHGRGTLLYI